MARTFSPSEYIGSLEASIRAPESSAPAVGCALVEAGTNQLGWTASPVALDSAVVHKTGSESISGDKTFSDRVTLRGSGYGFIEATVNARVAIGNVFTSMMIGSTGAYLTSGNYLGWSNSIQGPNETMVSGISGDATNITTQSSGGLKVTTNGTTLGTIQAENIHTGGAMFNLKLGTTTNQGGYGGLEVWQNGIKMQEWGGYNNSIFGRPVHFRKSELNGGSVMASMDCNTGELSVASIVKTSTTIQENLTIGRVSQGVVINNGVSVVDQGYGYYSFSTNGGNAFRADNAGVGITASGNGIMLGSGRRMSFSPTAQWYDTSDAQFGRSATAQAGVFANSGLAVKNLAGNADAPITTSAVVTNNTSLDFTSPTASGSRWRIDHAIPGTGGRIQHQYGSSVMVDLSGRSDQLGLEFASADNAYIGLASIGSGDGTRNGFRYFTPANGGGVQLIASSGSALIDAKLRMGGTTSSFPMLKQTGATVAFRLADDSAGAPIAASTVTASNFVATATVTGIGGMVLNNSFALHGGGHFYRDSDGQVYLKGSPSGLNFLAPSGDVNLQGGDVGGHLGTYVHGGNVKIRGGNAASATSSAGNGGAVYVHGGTKINAGNDGNTILAHTGSAVRGKVLVGKSTDNDAAILQVAGGMVLTGEIGSYDLPLAGMNVSYGGTPIKINSQPWYNISVMGLSGDSRTAYGWSVGNASPTMTTALMQASAGVVEINNGTLGQYRDLVARSITASGSLGNTLIKSSGAELEFTRNSVNYIRATGASGSLNFGTGGVDGRLVIAANGTATFANIVKVNPYIELYDNTGTLSGYIGSGVSLHTSGSSASNDLALRAASRFGVSTNGSITPSFVIDATGAATFTNNGLFVAGGGTSTADGTNYFLLKGYAGVNLVRGKSTSGRSDLVLGQAGGYVIFDGAPIIGGSISTGGYQVSSVEVIPNLNAVNTGVTFVGRPIASSAADVTVQTAAAAAANGTLRLKAPDIRLVSWNGSTTQEGYRQEYNAGGLRSAIYGKTPIAQLTAPSVATDLASAITAVNTHTSSLTSFGLYA